MTTWREARLAKEARQRRNRRHYTPDLMGPPCSAGCGTRIPKALADTGITAHPSCGPDADDLRRRATTGHRHGETYSPRLDYRRLNAQARRVYDAMADHRWHTLAELASTTGDPEASVSARLRDFRKPEFGGAEVTRRRRTQGTWEYRMPEGKMLP